MVNIPTPHLPLNGGSPSLLYLTMDTFPLPMSQLFTYNQFDCWHIYHAMSIGCQHPHPSSFEHPYTSHFFSPILNWLLAHLPFYVDWLPSPTPHLPLNGGSPSLHYLTIDTFPPPICHNCSHIINLIAGTCTMLLPMAANTPRPPPLNRWNPPHPYTSHFFSPVINLIAGTLAMFCQMTVIHHPTMNIGTHAIFCPMAATPQPPLNIPTRTMLCTIATIHPTPYLLWTGAPPPPMHHNSLYLY